MVWEDHGFVFCTADGAPLNQVQVRAQVKELVQQAALPHLLFHDLRASVIRLLAWDLHIPIAVVQMIVGIHWINSVPTTHAPIAFEQVEAALTSLHALLDPGTLPSRIDGVELQAKFEDHI